MTNMKPTYTRTEVVALLERAAQVADRVHAGASETALEACDDTFGVPMDVGNQHYHYGVADGASAVAATIRRMAEELPE